jgi:uncharacterized membrane protein YqiK
LAPTCATPQGFTTISKIPEAGRFRGRQLQVVVEGTWYINRLFATVEPVPKSVIPVGNVGVVIFYTGPKTADLSGEQYRHGELVLNGSRGVWRDPMLPGNYAFNTHAGKIEIIPTVNFILKWVRGEVGALSSTKISRRYRSSPRTSSSRHCRSPWSCTSTIRKRR